MNTTTPKLLDSLRSGVAVSATCGMAGGGMMGAGLALSVLGFAAIFPGIALVVLVSGAVLGAAAGASAGLAGLVGGCVGALLINRPATTCLARPLAAVAGAVAGAVVWIILLSLSAW